MGEIFLFPDFLIEDAASAFAEDGGEDGESGGVGVIHAGDSPSHVEPAEFGRELFVRVAAGELGRFFGDEDGRIFFAGRRGESFFELGEDGFFVHITDDDESEVRRGVAGVVVIEDILAGQRVVNIEVSDDGDAVGGRGVEGF